MWYIYINHWRWRRLLLLSNLFKSQNRRWHQASSFPRINPCQLFISDLTKNEDFFTLAKHLHLSKSDLTRTEMSKDFRLHASPSSKSDQLLISINFDNNVMTKALIWQHAKQTHQQFNHYYYYSKSLADQSRFPILPASLRPPSSYQEPKVPQDVLLLRRVQTLLPKKLLSKFSTNYTKTDH